MIHLSDLLQLQPSIIISDILLVLDYFNGWLGVVATIILVDILMIVVFDVAMGWRGVRSSIRRV